MADEKRLSVLDELMRAFADGDHNGVEDALECSRDVLRHGGADE